MSETTNSGIFYGWKIVSALFIMLSFSSGLGFYSHTIYLQALANQAGFSITLASTAVSVFFFVSGISGVLIAPLLEKYDIRIIIAAGTVCASLSLWQIGSVQTPFELFVVYIFFGFGFTASSLLPATTLVARWFDANRARALSITSTGLSLGGIVLTPLCVTLVEDKGLSVATPIIATMYLFGILPMVLVLRSRPSDLNLNPDGGSSGFGAAMSRSIGFREALAHPFFWSFSISYLFVMMSQVGAIAHQYGLLSERMSIDQSRYAITLLPFFSVIGRLAGGWFLHKFNTIKFTLFMMGLQVVSLSIVSSASAIWLLAFGLAAFGLSVGNLLMLQPLIIAEVYGLKDYARLYSWANLLSMLGLASGPGIMGAIYAMTQSYQQPYMMAACAGLTSCFIFILVKPPTNQTDVPET